MPEVTTSTATVRRLGPALSAGAAVWALSMATVGLNDETPGWAQLSEISGVAFQPGLFAPLAVQVRTMAAGTSRLARGVLRTEQGLLVVASVATVSTTVSYDSDHVALAVLDAFWQLSMLGTFVLPIKIAVAGRWRGVLRGWPVVAESWAVAVIPLMAVVGPGSEDVAGSLHLLVGYVTLGVLLAVRPELTGARAE